MYTGGYDVALQIDESLLNRALAAAYYRGLFYVKKDYQFQSPDIPPALQQFARVAYSVKLGSPPLLDFVDRDRATVLINTVTTLFVIGSIEIEVEADITVTVGIVYDNARHSLKLDFQNADITAIQLNDRFNLNSETRKKLNDLLDFIARYDVLAKFEAVSLPSSLFQLSVPTVPESHRLPVSCFQGAVVDGKRFRAGIDLFSGSGGSFPAIQLGNQSDFSIAVTESVVQKIIDFWWQYTTVQKSIATSESQSLDDIDKFVNGANDIAAAAITIATAGLVGVDVDFSNSSLNYGATVTLRKPSVSISSGNRFSLVNTSVDVYLWANVVTDISIDKRFLLYTEHEDQKNVTLFSLSENVTVTVKNATGRVYLDDQLALKGKVESLDVDISLGDDWIEKLASDAVNTIIDWVKGIIVSLLPEIPLFPRIVDLDAPSLGYTFQLAQQELSTTDNEIFVRVNGDIEQFKTIPAPLPGFIANKHTMEVHRIYCNVLDEMNETNKVGYFVLMDALNQGYDACAKCIPSYSKR